MKVLNIIASAYRATLEEQDDTVVWLSHALKGAGAEVDVLLRGAAVNYIVRGQEVTPLAIGARAQKEAPDVHGQIAALRDKGVAVFIVSDDLEVRALSSAAKLDGVSLVGGERLPELLSRYDRVWHW